MHDKLIQELETLKSELYDRESEELRQLTPERKDDYYGNHMRGMYHYRQQVDLLTRTINTLRESH